LRLSTVLVLMAVVLAACSGGDPSSDQAVPSQTANTDPLGSSRVQVDSENPTEQAIAAAEQAYLSINLPGWDLVAASDLAPGPVCGNGGNHFVPSTEWVRPEQPGRPELWARVSAGVPCEKDLALTAAELGLPGELDDAVDLGPTAVSGNEARVFVAANGPAYAFRWLISDSASGWLIVAGSGSTLEDAEGVAAAVIEITESRWVDLGAQSATRYLSPASVDAPVIGLDHPGARYLGGVAVRTPYGPSYELDWQLDGYQVDMWGALSPQWPWEEAFAPNAQPVMIRGYHGFFDAWESGNERYFWREGGMTHFVRIRPSSERDREILKSLVALTQDQVVELTGGWTDLSDG